MCELYYDPDRDEIYSYCIHCGCKIHEEDIPYCEHCRDSLEDYDDKECGLELAGIFVCSEDCLHENLIEIDDESYCEHLYAQLEVVECFECKKMTKKDENRKDRRGNYYCYNCAEEKLERCWWCMKVDRKENMIRGPKRPDSGYYCSECFYARFGREKGTETSKKSIKNVTLETTFENEL